MAGLKVLFSVAGSPGHLHPTVPLARALRDRGHEIRIGTSAGMAAAVRRAGLEPAVTCPDVDAAARDAGTGGFDASQPMHQLRWVTGHIGSPMAEAVVEMARSWRPDLVIRDSLSLGAWVAAEELGIPTIYFGTTGVMPRPVAQMLLGEVIDNMRTRRGLAPDPELNAFHGLVAFDTTPPSLLDAFAGFTPERSPLRPVQWTGNDDDEAPPWLDQLGDRDLLYVTLGTVTNRNPVVLRKLVAAVADLDTDVVMTIGRDGDANSLGQLPGNVKVAPYISQERIFSRASAVLCHAGRGTTYGALEVGLPVCLVPLGTDQPITAAAVEQAGAGVVCATGTVPIGPNQLPIALPENLSVETLRGAVMRVLTDAGLRGRARDIAAEIAAMPAPEDAAVEVENALGAAVA